MTPYEQFNRITSYNVCYTKLLRWLDAVIELIRAARNPEEAKQGLMAGNFSDPQFLKKLGLPEEKRSFAPSVKLSA